MSSDLNANIIFGTMYMMCVAHLIPHLLQLPTVRTVGIGGDNIHRLLQFVCCLCAQFLLLKK
jgi:hypothetical protein